MLLIWMYVYKCVYLDVSIGVGPETRRGITEAKKKHNGPGENKKLYVT